LFLFCNQYFSFLQQLEKEIAASEAELQEADRIAAESARDDDICDHPALLSS